MLRRLSEGFSHGGPKKKSEKDEKHLPNKLELMYGLVFFLKQNMRKKRNESLRAFKCYFDSEIEVTKLKV